MRDSAGINAVTGRPLSDWGHVEQSIRKILTTPIGSRVMRRTFGSDLPDMVDRKMTAANILKVYSAAALAILRWEPRFRMSAGRIAAATPDGRLAIEIYGTYYPRGHLGDYSVAENASTRVVYGG
ncbi:GPW/gp25 family protein [Shinella zoogloeoides]|uniref:GPW/gp25 family protein n=1 Tax=Shinella zoogloeoides TaxID=352475 RepID=UPI001F57815F|nr:GPW/gp25 family protein [Shinella zoogloeoides]